MNNHKEFKTLGASNAWAKERHLVWYTNFIKGGNCDPIDGLKEHAGESVKYVITKVGETYQIFYKGK